MMSSWLCEELTGRSFMKNGELLDIRRVHMSPNNSAVILYLASNCKRKCKEHALILIAAFSFIIFPSNPQMWMKRCVCIDCSCVQRIADECFIRLWFSYAWLMCGEWGLIQCMFAGHLIRYFIWSEDSRTCFSARYYEKYTFFIYILSIQCKWLGFCCWFGPHWLLLY